MICQRWISGELALVSVCNRERYINNAQVTRILQTSPAGADTDERKLWEEWGAAVVRSVDGVVPAEVSREQTRLLSPSPGRE